MQGWMMKQRPRRWRLGLRRWFAGWSGALLTAALCALGTGCRQQVFLDQECFKLSHQVLPAGVEDDYTYASGPINPTTKAIRTIDFNVLGNNAPAGGFSFGADGNIHYVAVAQSTVGGGGLYAAATLDFIRCFRNFIVQTTSSAVNGTPSDHFRPGRRW